MAAITILDRDRQPFTSHPELMDQGISSSTVDVLQLKSWLPVDAVLWDGKPGIEWMNMTDVAFSEPFFNQTVARVRKSDQSVITGLEELIRVEKVVDSLSPPTGFIFHSSRSGSTLLANACRCLDGSLVICEAPVLDKLISRFFTDVDAAGNKELLYSVFLRAAVKALGQRRLGNERYYFIKFSSISILQLQRIRRIWPQVPAVFLYRDPVEVIVSNVQNIPEWMKVESNPKAAAAVVGVTEQDLGSLGPEEFCARALGRFYTAAASAVDNNTLVYNYRHLSAQNLLRLVEFFGVSISNEEAEAIRQTSQLYSKDISRPFHDDSDLKRSSASILVKEMADKWARAPYEVLENTS